jgi:hypothetical protein
MGEWILRRFDPFQWGIPKFHVHFLFPYAHLNFFGWITQRILGEECKASNSSLGNFPSPCLFISMFLLPAFTDQVERNCHFPAPGWNCMTHRQALQGFPDTSQVSLHKNNKINLLCRYSRHSRNDSCVELYQWTQSTIPDLWHEWGWEGS